MKEQPDGRSKCVEDRIALGEDGEVDKDRERVACDCMCPSLFRFCSSNLCRLCRGLSQ